jgi:hypothetical protein
MQILLATPEKLFCFPAYEPDQFRAFHHHIHRAVLRHAGEVFFSPYLNLVKSKDRILTKNAQRSELFLFGRCFFFLHETVIHFRFFVDHFVRCLLLGAAISL